MKKRIVEIAVKVIVAALTAFLTAITTTSCMGLGPIPLDALQITGNTPPISASYDLGAKFPHLQNSPLKAERGFMYNKYLAFK